MSEEKGNTITQSMQAGLVLGVVTSALNIVGWLLPSTSFLQTIISITLILVTFYCIIHYTKQYIDKICGEETLNGPSVYGKTLFFGWYMVIFCAMVFAFCSTAFLILFPKVFDALLQTAAQTATVLQTTAEESDRLANEIKKYTLKDFAYAILWGYTILGALLVVFTSFYFVRRNKKIRTPNS